jgi:predicted transposase/invertase (TIGR01784 family)
MTADPLFYKIFQNLPELFFELIGEGQHDKTGYELITRTNSEITSPALKEKVLQFIQTVVMDKLPNLSVKELEAMLELESLRKSKVFLEGREEGIEMGVLKQKIETIPILLEVGLTIEQIAERLKLDVKTVQKNVKQ